MGRALIVLHQEKDRRTAMAWLQKALLGTRLEFRGPKRTLPQNDKMWAMLTDIAVQVDHHGRRYPADVWKRLVMDQLSREVADGSDYIPDFIPSIDDTTVVSIGYESSKLSIPQMAELIDYLYVFGAEKCVKWSDPNIAIEESSYEQMRTK